MHFWYFWKISFAIFPKETLKEAHLPSLICLSFGQTIIGLHD